ncbi:MAG: hypothetical protein JJE27_08170 [Thermoleophilia bacterium]|nr:hypothetical protein [Thermoleophilia bacterium]
MSENENPGVAGPGHTVTVDDVRALTGAATPHFSPHLRNRLRRLASTLPADDPARQLAELEIARLEQLAVELEHGPAGGSDLPSLRD